MAASAVLCLLVAVLAITTCNAQPISGSFKGTGTFYPGAINGWACDGRKKPAAGLPTVALNGVQFAMGQACGACIQVTGKSGALDGTFKVSVGNIFTQGSEGDLDFPRDGSGQHDISWSFIECPEGTSSSRRLLKA